MNKKYPIRLLPTVKDKIITNLNLQHFLIRWVNPEIPIQDEEGKLSPLAIQPTKRVYGLSTNKIPRSTIEDCKIVYFSEEEPWKEQDTPITITSEDFDYVLKRGYFLFTIQDIHEYVGSYPLNVKNKEQIYNFIVLVTHKPLKHNYCHFELTVLDKDQKIIKPSKGRWRKIIAHAIQSKLIEIAQFDLPETDNFKQ